MTHSLRTSVPLFALLLACFAFPVITQASSTVCYPDGCATFNFDGLTRTQLETSIGIQASLAQAFETIFQIVVNVGHKLDNVIRDGAGRIVFLACDNSHTHAAYYSECPPGFVRQGGQCVPASTSTSTSTCPIGYIEQGNRCVLSTCPQGYAFQDGQCVYRNLCTTHPRCNGSDLVNSCTGAMLQVCDWGCAAGECNPVPAPSATLRAIPSLVHSGDITTVSWAGTNVSSCTVHGTNGDSWTGTSSTGKTSSPILGQTIYTLHCTGYQYAYPPSVDMSVTVNLIPTFNEQ